MREYTKAQKELIGALIGLARSLDESNSSFDMLEIMMQSIRLLDREDEGIISEQIRQVHEAKYKAVPDCSSCQNPCGRTFDYDLENLEQLGEELKKQKMELLEQIFRYACGAKYQESDYKETLRTLTDALYAAGYDWFSIEEINAKTERLREISSKSGLL